MCANLSHPSATGKLGDDESFEPSICVAIRQAHESHPMLLPSPTLRIPRRALHIAKRAPYTVAGDQTNAAAKQEKNLMQGGTKAHLQTSNLRPHCLCAGKGNPTHGGPAHVMRVASFCKSRSIADTGTMGVREGERGWMEGKGPWLDRMHGFRGELWIVNSCKSKKKAGGAVSTCRTPAFPISIPPR